MLKNEKGKFFLSVIIVLIIVSFLIWQGVVFINADINDNIGELKDKKVSRDVYNLKRSSLEQELDAYNFSRNKIKEINNHFVYASDNDDTEFTSFFGQLDSFAMQSTQKEKSLTIDLYQNEPSTVKDGENSGGSINSSFEKNNKEEDSRFLKLTLKSNFESLLKFISYLEAMPYYVYIESVNINIDSGARAKENLDKGAVVSNSVNLQSVLIIKVFRKMNILYYE